MNKTALVLSDVGEERQRQDDKWGTNRHLPDAIRGFAYGIGTADEMRAKCDRRAAQGTISHADILLEEVAEALDEARVGNVDWLRKELVQVAAVAVNWIEDIDRRGA